MQWKLYLQLLLQLQPQAALQLRLHFLHKMISLISKTCLSEIQSNASTHSESNRGEKSFSEPESDSIAKFILKNKNNLHSYVILHVDGDLWMYSYANKKQPMPKDVAYLVSAHATNPNNRLHVFLQF